MKKVVIILFCLLSFASVGAQDFPDSLRGNYSITMKDISRGTPAPKGYKPFYVSHYGRHGARYLVRKDFYTKVFDVLDEAASLDALTPLGKEFYEKASAFYKEQARGREGELTEVGWNQHKKMATQLYKSYPELFRRHPAVEATCTQVPRSILSMASFCTALKGLDPKLDIHEDTNNNNLPFLNPVYGMVDKIFRAQSPEDDFFYLNYLKKTLDTEAIDRRLFKDGFRPKDSVEFAFYLYNFIAGAICVDENEQFSSMGILSSEDARTLFESLNLFFYSYVFMNRESAMALADDIIEKAELDMKQPVPPIRLRFGHETAVLGLISALNINGFGAVAATPEDVSKTFRVNHTPMGISFFFIFYRKGDDVLFKMILGGEEATLPIPSVSGPYYRWSDFVALCRSTRPCT